MKLARFECDGRIDLGVVIEGGVIGLHEIVNRNRNGFRYSTQAFRLARRLLRVVPHPEAGEGVFGGRISPARQPPQTST